jgi:large subunit ribosomal protein L4
MAKVSVYNIEGKEVDTLELNDAVFGVEINEHLVHMAVLQQLANKRQGTQKAKTRSEVSGGGRKPWRQKGTGHARQGSTRAPQWTGGGVVFAPTPRDYSFKMNRKEKALAIKSALTSKVNDNKIVVLDSFVVDEIKTKNVANVLGNLNVAKALIVTNGKNKNLELSANNIPSVRVSSVEVINSEDKKVVNSTINVYDIVKYDTLVVTKDAVKAIEEVYA